MKLPSIDFLSLALLCEKFVIHLRESSGNLVTQQWGHPVRSECKRCSASMLYMHLTIETFATGLINKYQLKFLDAGKRKDEKFCERFHLTVTAS